MTEFTPSDAAQDASQARQMHAGRAESRTEILCAGRQRPRPYGPAAPFGQRPLRRQMGGRSWHRVHGDDYFVGVHPRDIRAVVVNPDLAIKSDGLHVLNLLLCSVRIALHRVRAGRPCRVESGAARDLVGIFGCRSGRHQRDGCRLRAICCCRLRGLKVCAARHLAADAHEKFGRSFVVIREGLGGAQGQHFHDLFLLPHYREAPVGCCFAADVCIMRLLSAVRVGINPMFALIVCTALEKTKC